MRTTLMRIGTAMKTNILGAAALLAMVLLATGCPSAVQADCQTMPSAQGGYVLHFTRSGAATPGCETDTPAEMSDVWVFDTLFDSQIRAHSVLMPFPDVDTLPANLIGSGKFTTREADSNNRCKVESLTTMSDDSSGTLLSYAVGNMEWLGGPAYQGAEFQTDITVTVGTCTASYTSQALSPAVGCVDDHDCDPFKQPFSSGIFSVFDQGCTTEGWTSGALAYLNDRDGTTADPTPYAGVCFFRKPFPGLK
jgi:hypothetical protein